MLKSLESSMEETDLLVEAKMIPGIQCLGLGFGCLSDLVLNLFDTQIPFVSMAEAVTRHGGPPHLLAARGMGR
jgi:hypothetical protein